MALEEGVNSYVSLADADGYMADRANSQAWVDASDADKEQSLVTASRTLNAMSWEGITVSVSQTLAFPRSGQYFDPLHGQFIQFVEDEIPSRVKEAVVEMAYHFLVNTDVLDEGSSIDDIKVGPIELKGLSKVSSTPPTVYRLVAPFRKNGGAALWWRVN